jgi:hypothetical protein
MSGSLPLPAGAAEILQLFSGRRRGRRVPSSLDVECRGKTAQFRGRIVNVSHVGALIRVRHRSFRAGEGGLLAIVGRVHSAFPKGVLLAVHRMPVVVRAKVVRVAQAVNEGFVLLGCEFHRRLTARERELLGVDVEGNERTE